MGDEGLLKVRFRDKKINRVYLLRLNSIQAEPVRSEDNLGEEEIERKPWIMMLAKYVCQFDYLPVE